MPLDTSDQLRGLVNAHGLRPFDYVLEIAPEQVPTFWTFLPSAIPPIIPWKQIPTRIDSMTLGHGSDADELTFVTWDPSTTEAEHTIPQVALVAPTVGMLVCMQVFDITAPGGRVLFRGTIRAVHTRDTASGTEWVATAISDITRLNDFHVTFTSNLRNNPVNPSPRFDVAGNYVQPFYRTTSQIIQCVMDFLDAFNSPQYFQYSDFKWPTINSGLLNQTATLETDLRCGAYIPSNVNFSDTPKGKAIESLLETAGNFSFIYVPTRMGRGYIQIVEHNLACNRCGPLWNISWVTPGAANLTDPPYSAGYTIQEDGTEWNSRESANVCRLTTAPIRWYTGHWMIPEVYTDADELTQGFADPSTRNLVVFDNDTIENMQERAIGPDLANYRFSFARDNADSRKLKVYPVGVPLFPDWNIHEDYLPAQIEIGMVTVPSGVVLADNSTPTETSYEGIVEFQSYSVGDLIAGNINHVRYPDNLRSFQAWHTSGVCPACNGSGLVTKVYDNDANEPSLKWEAVSSSGRREISAGDKPHPGERVLFQVTNYIFNPKDFGTGASFGSLEPFNEASYPNPCKNLCPYCRGIGLNPDFKIRNIDSSLYEGRNNQVTSPSGITIGANEIPIDPDYTQVGPETWQQTNNRLTLREGAWLVVEQAVPATTLPDFAFRNYSFKQLHKLTSTQLRHQFDNPLTFNTLTKTLTAKCGLNPADAAAQIVPPAWKCEVPFTTVVMGTPDYDLDNDFGRVLFKQPSFIWCRKQFTDYYPSSPNHLLLDTNGMLKPRSPGRGQIMADRNWVGTGFWRYARCWLTAYYTRPNVYDYLFEDANGNAIPNVTFTAPTPDGEIGNYAARCSIHDGRLVIEVMKTNPDANEAGGTLFPTGNRLMQTTMSDMDSRIETSVDDFKKFMVPTVLNLGSFDFGVWKKSYTDGNGDSLDFVYGRILKMERTSPGEKLLEDDGWVDQDFANSLIRPKMYRWTHVDDRSRLLALCVRRLEASNNLLVSGTLSLRGISNDFSTGLGFVNRPGYGLAGVKRVTYRFGDEGMSVELELSREEARVGERLPKDADVMNTVVRDQARLTRLVEELAATQNRSQSPIGDDAGPPTTGGALIRPS